MPGYRDAIVSVLLWAAAAHAGVVVELSPMPSSSPGLPKGAYLGGELVSVDVLLTQNPPSDDVFIRFLRFDFDDTDSDLQLSLPVLDDGTGIGFWDFSSTGCGLGCYAIDDDLGGDQPGRISIEWQLDFPAPDFQLTLPGDGSPLLVGTLEVRMPPLLGRYHLDVLNADETDPNFGGELGFGFGDDDPITTWRAEFGDITGGTFDFSSGIPEPSTLLLLALGAGALLRRGQKYGAWSACCSRHR